MSGEYYRDSQRDNGDQFYDGHRGGIFRILNDNVDAKVKKKRQK